MAGETTKGYIQLGHFSLKRLTEVAVIDVAMRKDAMCTFWALHLIIQP